MKPLCALAREPGIFTSTLRTGLSQVAGVSVVAPMSPDLSAGITHWGVGGLTGRQLQDELWTRRTIRVRAGGDKVVRQSTHIYNNLAEIEATIGVAKALAARQAASAHGGSESGRTSRAPNSESRVANPGATTSR